MKSTVLRRQVALRTHCSCSSELNECLARMILGPLAFTISKAALLIFHHYIDIICLRYDSVGQAALMLRPLLECESVTCPETLMICILPSV